MGSRGRTRIRVRDGQTSCFLQDERYLMNRWRIAGVTAVVIAAFSVYLIGRAGSLEPPGPPSPTMVTLDEISAKLDALTGPSFQFVSVTTAVRPANVGWKGMSDACQKEFRSKYPSVRFCTSQEMLDTPVQNWPAATASAWVQPKIVDSGGALATDASGRDAGRPAEFNCFSWTTATGSTTGLALVVAPGSVAFDLRQCDWPLHVACCAPTAETR